MLGNILREPPEPPGTHAPYDMRASFRLLKGTARFRGEIVWTSPSKPPWKSGLEPERRKPGN